MEGFLNSKSMLTPGVAGGLVVSISAALTAQFLLPGNWTALAISFLLGGVVFVDPKTKKVEKIILYLLNSLVIFTVAVGANTTGRAVSGAAAEEEVARDAEIRASVLAEVQDSTEQHARETAAQIERLAAIIEASPLPPAERAAAATAVDAAERAEVMEAHALEAVKARPPRELPARSLLPKLFR
jgi:hypothetical protein